MNKLLCIYIPHALLVAPGNCYNFIIMAMHFYTSTKLFISLQFLCVMPCTATLVHTSNDGQQIHTIPPPRWTSVQAY